jgi:hypothetical protein
MYVRECAHTFVWEDAECEFGCGARVHRDSGMCPKCHDHAQNEVPCAKCDTLFYEADAERYDAAMYAVERGE